MLCVEYYSEKGKGRIYSFLVNFFAGRRKYFPEIRIYRSDVINNSIYGNMRRIGVGKVQNHPWRPGDFAEMVILKNEAESGFRRPEKSAVFSDTRRSVRFLCLTFRSRDIAVLTSHRAEAGACTTSSILFAVHITEFRDVFDTDFFVFAEFIIFICLLVVMQFFQIFADEINRSAGCAGVLFAAVPEVMSGTSV